MNDGSDRRTGLGQMKFCAAANPIVIIAVWCMGCAAQRADVVRSPETPRGIAELEHVYASRQPTPESQAGPGSGSPRRPIAVALPETISQDRPQYPIAAVDRGIACTAEILYHVETDGSARLVQVEWPVLPDAEYQAAFETSIRDAVAAWSFEPAYQLVFAGKSEGPVYERRVVPHAARAFVRFRVEDGKAVVE